jgi:hypothetical protein
MKKIFVTSDTILENSKILREVMGKLLKKMEPDDPTPLVFIRDRKADNSLVRWLSCSCYKNEKGILLGLRTVQYRADWEESKNAGIERNNKIFEKDLSYVVVFKQNSEVDNGIDHVIYLAYVKQIPLIIITDDCINYYKSLDTYPIKDIKEFVEVKEEVFAISDLDKKEYDEKMKVIIRKVRSMYYQTKNDKPQVKIIDELTEPLKKNKKKKKKKTSKTKSKNYDDSCFLKEETYE